MSNSDPIDDMMALLGANNDKLILANLAEKNLDIMLKYVTIMYYAHEMDDDRLITELDRKVRPGLELIVDNFDQEVRKYQEAHGEI